VSRMLARMLSVIEKAESMPNVSSAMKKTIPKYAL